MTDSTNTRLTERLRLEPIGPANARDLWLVHNDDDVAKWYDGVKPSAEDTEREAKVIAYCWRVLGIHKWIAYDRLTGELIGRGGCSRTPVDDDWGQIHAFLPPEPWVREPHGARRPRVHAHWLEIGWALLPQFWGQGYASEIGRAGLDYAFDVLGVEAVVSCTARHNTRSRAVMERIGMRYVGEIRTRGMAEGEREERDDAPFAVSVLLQTERVRP